MTTHYKNPRIYIIVTYVVFWLGIFLTGGIYILSKNDVVMTLGTILLSWVPTIVVLIFFNKLVPNANRTNWIKEAFTSKIKTGMVAAVTLAFTLSVVFTYIIMLHRSSDVSIIDFKSLSISSITLTVFNAIITGATGEELGWRGYLQRYFEENSNGNVIKSSLKVSLVWSFWHTPLWFVSSAGQPMDYYGTRQPLHGAAVLWSYDSRSQRRPGILPALGVRGKYSVQQTIGAARLGPVCLATAQTSPGAAAPFVDRNGKPAGLWTPCPDVEQG